MLTEKETNSAETRKEEGLGLLLAGLFDRRVATILNCGFGYAEESFHRSRELF